MDGKYDFVATARIAIAIACGTLSGGTQAEISVDGSLGGPSGPLTKLENEYRITEDLGRVRGSNLFHSFGVFNVDSGEVANFTGNSPIANILSRVTGGTASNINGMIKSSDYAGANLYLINPYGIHFGPYASLNVDGSFHATTADYVRLGTDGFFHADLEKQSTLTTAPPTAFGFLEPQRGSISVEGSTLDVSEGSTLSLIGGDVDIKGAGEFQIKRTLNAPSGEVRLVGVGSPRPEGGEVRPVTGGAGVEMEGFPTQGDVTLSQGAFVSASPEYSSTEDIAGGGSVFIRGGKFTVNSAYIAADTGDSDGAPVGIDIDVQGEVVLNNRAQVTTDIVQFGSGNAGDIRVAAQSLEVTGDAVLRSAGVWQTLGDPGKVTVEAQRVKISDGGKIASSTGFKGDGNAGGVTIEASERVQISGGGDTGLFSQSGAGSPDFVFLDFNRFNYLLATRGFVGIGFGNGGPIEVNVEGGTLEMAGGVIETRSSRYGNAGDVAVTAGRIELKNFALIDTGTDSSAWGDAGHVRVTASDEILIEGAPKTDDGGFTPTGIFASSEGYGNAGQIVLEAPTVNLTGRAVVGSQALNAWGGSGGDIRIDAKPGTLTGTGGPLILTSTHSPNPGGKVKLSGRSLTLNDVEVQTLTTADGRAGDIEVEADYVTLDGSRVKTTTEGRGRAGDITIKADQVTLGNGTQLQTTTWDRGNAGNVTVTAEEAISLDAAEIQSATVDWGDAGDIALEAKEGQVTLRNGAKLRATTWWVGDAGDIIVTADRVVLDNAEIEAETRRWGGGGNVSVVADDLLLTNGASLAATTQSVRDAGDVNVTAERVELRDRAIIESASLSESIDGGDGGNVTVTADEAFTITGPSRTGTNFTPTGIFVTTHGGGDAGTVEIRSPTVMLQGGTVVIAGQSLEEMVGGRAGTIVVDAAKSFTATDGAFILLSSSGPNPAGLLDIRSETVSLDDALVQAQTGGRGKGGDIRVKGSQIRLINGAAIGSGTTGLGPGGTVTIDADMLALDSGARIMADTSSSEFIADLAVVLDILHSWDSDLDVWLQSPEGTRVELFTDVGGSGQNFLGTRLHDGGLSFILGEPPFTGTFAPEGTLAELVGEPATGVWTLSIGDDATGDVGELKGWSLEPGGQLFTSDDVPKPIADLTTLTSTLFVDLGPDAEVGPMFPQRGGDIIINVNSAQVQGGAAISANTTGAGHGGRVQVTATEEVALSGPGSGVFTDAEGSGAGGDIFVRAATIGIRDGATVSAKSTETGDAGNVYLIAGNSIFLDGSAVTTEATLASGGNIKLTAPDIVKLSNSNITSSVQGGADTVGGDIGIDPRFVILNHSEISANAIEGEGGNIHIVTDYFIASTDSRVTASSERGIDGTVVIDAPEREVAGSVTALPSEFLDTSALMRGHCGADRAAGKASSLIVAGQDGVAPAPDGYLPSFDLGEPQGGKSATTSALHRSVHPDEWLGEDARQMVALRKLECS